MTSTGLEARLVVRRGASFLLDVGMVLAPDETAVLLGPSGAGKSTVVASLAGLLPIEEGNISLQGEVLDDPGGGVFRPPEDRHVGVVFQDYLLFPHMSVIENVAFGLRSRRMARRQARRRAGEWLERMGLEGLSDRRPGELSGGQTQRVALARALVAEPAMLLLDEPLSALDTTTRLSLRRTLAEHLDGFTGPRLLITHDPEEAFLLADVIHVIDGGSVTQVGTPDEIRLRPRTSYAADVGGSNLVEGTAAAGIVHTAAHDLHVADHDVSGRVLAAIRPSAISVHLHRPHGSPRNTWPTTVELIEPLGERVRLRTGPPLPLTAEITDDAARTLALGEGTGVWVSVKATEITVQAQPEDTGPGDRCG